MHYLLFMRRRRIMLGGRRRLRRRIGPICGPRDKTVSGQALTYFVCLP
jgi:hypothetical protein